MSESFDWEQKLSREEAVEILAQEKHQAGYLSAYDGTDFAEEEGWERAELSGPVKEDH